MDSAQNGKSELAVPELDGPGSPDLCLLGEDGGADDGDGVGRGPVVAGHFGVELADCAVEGDVAVLLVHVVVAGSGLVPEDDAEGLDVGGSPLEDLVDGEDLALCALGLELPAQVVPELGLGDDLVPGEEADGVHLGIGVALGWHLAAQHEVLTDLSYGESYLHLEGGISGILGALQAQFNH